MLTLALNIVALILVLIATAFSVIAVVGYFRLPDVYTRLHAAGMAATFGVVLLVLSTIFLIGVSAAKAMILAALIIIAAPVASHLTGSTAYRIGIPLKSSRKDDLAKHARW